MCLAKCFLIQPKLDKPLFDGPPEGGDRHFVVQEKSPLTDSYGIIGVI